MLTHRIIINPQTRLRGRTPQEVVMEVVDQVPIMPPINEYNAGYLATKRDKLGHRLPPDN
mgnify:CR=1 FL=1